MALLATGELHPPHPLGGHRGLLVNKPREDRYDAKVSLQISTRTENKPALVVANIKLEVHR